MRWRPRIIDIFLFAIFLISPSFSFPLEFLPCDSDRFKLACAAHVCKEVIDDAQAFHSYDLQHPEFRERLAKIIPDRLSYTTALKQYYLTDPSKAAVKNYLACRIDYARALGVLLPALDAGKIGMTCGDLGNTAGFDDRDPRALTLDDLTRQMGFLKPLQDARLSSAEEIQARFRGAFKTLDEAIDLSEEKFKAVGQKYPFDDLRRRYEVILSHDLWTVCLRQKAAAQSRWTQLNDELRRRQEAVRISRLARQRALASAGALAESRSVPHDIRSADFPPSTPTLPSSLNRRGLVAAVGGFLKKGWTPRVSWDEGVESLARDSRLIRDHPKSYPAADVRVAQHFTAVYDDTVALGALYRRRNNSPKANAALEGQIQRARLKLRNDINRLRAALGPEPMLSAERQFQDYDDIARNKANVSAADGAPTVSRSKERNGEESESVDLALLRGAPDSGPARQLIALIAGRLGVNPAIAREALLDNLKGSGDVALTWPVAAPGQKSSEARLRVGTDLFILKAGDCTQLGSARRVLWTERETPMGPPSRTIYFPGVRARLHMRVDPDAFSYLIELDRAVGSGWKNVPEKTRVLQSQKQESAPRAFQIFTRNLLEPSARDGALAGSLKVTGKVGGNALGAALGFLGDVTALIGANAQIFVADAGLGPKNSGLYRLNAVANDAAAQHMTVKKLVNDPAFHGLLADRDALKELDEKVYAARRENLRALWIAPETAMDKNHSLYSILLHQPIRDEERASYLLSGVYYGVNGNRYQIVGMIGDNPLDLEAWAYLGLSFGPEIVGGARAVPALFGALRTLGFAIGGAEAANAAAMLEKLYALRLTQEQVVQVAEQLERACQAAKSYKKGDVGSHRELAEAITDLAQQLPLAWGTIESLKRHPVGRKESTAGRSPAPRQGLPNPIERSEAERWVAMRTAEARGKVAEVLKKYRDYIDPETIWRIHLMGLQEANYTKKYRADLKKKVESLREDLRAKGLNPAQISEFTRALIEGWFVGNKPGEAGAAPLSAERYEALLNGREPSNYRELVLSIAPRFPEIASQIGASDPYKTRQLFMMAVEKASSNRPSVEKLVHGVNELADTSVEQARSILKWAKGMGGDSTVQKAAQEIVDHVNAKWKDQLNQPEPPSEAPPSHPEESRQGAPRPPPAVWTQVAYGNDGSIFTLSSKPHLIFKIFSPGTSIGREFQAQSDAYHAVPQAARQNGFRVVKPDQWGNISADGLHVERDGQNVMDFPTAVPQGHRGSPVLSMERIHGISLKEHMESGKPISARTWLAFHDGIAAMKSKGIFHWDLHSRNILVDDKGLVLIDFGRLGEEEWREQVPLLLEQGISEALLRSDLLSNDSATLDRVAETIRSAFEGANAKMDPKTMELLRKIESHRHSAGAHGRVPITDRVLNHYLNLIENGAANERRAAVGKLAGDIPKFAASHPKELLEALRRALDAADKHQDFEARGAVAREIGQFASNGFAREYPDQVFELMRRTQDGGTHINLLFPALFPRPGGWGKHTVSFFKALPIPQGLDREKVRAVAEDFNKIPEERQLRLIQIYSQRRLSEIDVEKVKRELSINSQPDHAGNPKPGAAVLDWLNQSRP